MTTFNRREFLQHTTRGSIVLPLQALLARAATGRPVRSTSVRTLGPLKPVLDRATKLPLLLLPAGFEYVTFGWARDKMSDGALTPALHDGMSAFPAGNDRVHLVRNHEVSTDAGAFTTPAYDPAAAGGTTTIEFDTRTGQVVRSWASLSGTLRNCAGGATPWGSWLTCEEGVDDPSRNNTLTKPHGYVFEVPTLARGTAEPLTALGRFVHEAVAVDPVSGTVYETEDRDTAGFYRFIPREAGRLAAGGALQMLAVKGRPQFDTRTAQPVGATYPVEWVPIDDPDRAHHDPKKGDTLGVFTQGYVRGGALFSRLEGAVYAQGGIYFVATSGGDARAGQIWQYHPVREELALVLESPGPHVLNHPDNICINPRGGLVLCENGSGVRFLHLLTSDGQLYPFAQNNVILSGERHDFRGDYRGGELAGSTFSPDGRWLFFNIQTPGLTVAVTGPWSAGRHLL